jgi:hypothetical protein
MKWTKSIAERSLAITAGMVYIMAMQSKMATPSEYGCTTNPENLIVFSQALARLDWEQMNETVEIGAMEINKAKLQVSLEILLEDYMGEQARVDK